MLRSEQWHKLRCNEMRAEAKSMPSAPSEAVTAHKSLLGASIPRSGHHYLQRILSHYFQDELFYCEWYTPRDCCKHVPCIKHLNCRITFQKSHDWDLSLDHN